MLHIHQPSLTALNLTQLEEKTQTSGQIIALLSVAMLYCIYAVGDDILAESNDLQHILSAIGETDLAETLALQEVIMQSQMPTVTTSGIDDFCSN